MSTEQTVSTNDNKYRVVSVTKANPPAGMEDGDWYRYVIGQGSSHMECTRLGTLNAVTKHAEEFAESLNLRASKGYSAYAARKQTKQPAAV
jgi:hypothetical protein